MEAQIHAARYGWNANVVRFQIVQDKLVARTAGRSRRWRSPRSRADRRRDRAAGRSARRCRRRRLACAGPIARHRAHRSGALRHQSHRHARNRPGRRPAKPIAPAGEGATRARPRPLARGGRALLRIEGRPLTHSEAVIFATISLLTSHLLPCMLHTYTVCIPRMYAEERWKSCWWVSDVAEIRHPRPACRTATAWL